MIWRADPHLASMAAGEVSSRQKHLPGMIERGEIERSDAETDLGAWRAIAAMLKIDNGPDAAGCIRNPREIAPDELTWAALELAAARALASLDERAVANPGDDYLARRRDAVQAIHARLAAHRGFWTAGGPIPADQAKAAA